jgi:hypothetical protein
LATPAADSNLSLGKLGRAAFGTATYTTEISMSDCAGNTTADQDHSIGGFYISAVDSSLTGYAYVDESTNETYEITFTNANSLFTSRIATRAGNFTWTTDNSSLFNIPASRYQGVTALMTGSAIADVSTPGSMESTLVTDGEFENWTGTTLLDDWTESGTIEKNTSGQSGNAVKFKSDGAYVEQSFTVKGNSVYQITASVYTADQDNSNMTAYISGAYHQTSGDRWTNIARAADQWVGFREDFYTSGSSNVNQTLKLKFTAPNAGTTGVYPSLDVVAFQRWEGANIGDTNVTITGKYNDSDGDDLGFNDHATRYNTAISKVVEIQDTYAGQAIACFLPGTMIRMADGTEKDIEDITVGDEILSSIIPNLPDEDLGYNEWKTFTSTDDMSTLSTDTATVEQMFYDYKDGYWNIKGYDLKDYNEFQVNVTAEHDLWSYRDDIWSWRKPTELKVGDHLLDFNGNLVKIDFLNYVSLEVEVINFDVEPLDVYYAGGLLVHNKGTNSDPE